MVDLAAVGLRLGLMIFRVFSNLNDSVKILLILCWSETAELLTQSKAVNYPLCNEGRMGTRYFCIMMIKFFPLQ